MSLHQRAVILPAEVRLGHDQALVSDLFVPQDPVDAAALKNRHHGSFEVGLWYGLASERWFPEGDRSNLTIRYRVSLVQCPAMNVLDPILLEVLAVGGQLHDAVCHMVVQVIFSPVQIVAHGVERR